LLNFGVRTKIPITKLKDVNILEDKMLNFLKNI